MCCSLRPSLYTWFFQKKKKKTILTLYVASTFLLIRIFFFISTFLLFQVRTPGITWEGMKKIKDMIKYHCYRISIQKAFLIGST